MAKHTQTICWEQPTNCLSKFDHFVGVSELRVKFLYVNIDNIEKIWGT